MLMNIEPPTVAQQDQGPRRPPATGDSGLINRKVLQLNIARSSLRAHTILSSSDFACFDILIFSDPWWGPIGNARDDLDPFRRLYGATATRQWDVFTPPIDFSDSAPSVIVYVHKGRGIRTCVLPDAPSTRYYFSLEVAIGSSTFIIMPVYFHGKEFFNSFRDFLSLPHYMHPTLFCGDFNVQHKDLARFPGAKGTTSPMGNEFLAWLADSDSTIHNDLSTHTREGKESRSTIDYTISNAYLSSMDIISDWSADFTLGVGSDHAGISFTISTSGPDIPGLERTLFHIDSAYKGEWISTHTTLISSHPITLGTEEVEDFTSTFSKA